MSTMTAGKSKTKAKTKKTKKADAAQAFQAQFSREAEAPDRGSDRSHREAPDSGLIREASDSGEGRTGYVEGEFTHGRSQS